VFVGCGQGAWIKDIVYTSLESNHLSFAGKKCNKEKIQKCGKNQAKNGKKKKTRK
jgi:hypothetical protein